MKAAKQNIRIQRWVLAISVLLFCAKLVAYYLTNSVAVLTDALEGIVNVVAGVIGLYSLHLSAKPRDTDHPYGHGKIEFLSAAVEGVMIIIAGILISIKAINQFIQPTEIKSLDVGILIVAFTSIVNFIMGTICIRVGGRNNSLALIASGRHLHSDTYSTIGIIVGLVLILLTGQRWLDSGVALVFSTLIIYTGFQIIRKSVAGIMDERDKALMEQLVTVADSNRSENWVDLHNVRIIKYGSTLHVDSHLTVPWYLNVHEAHDEVEKLGKIVGKQFGESIELFVHADGCLPISCPICIKENCPVRQHPFERRIQWTVQNIQADQKHQADTDS